MTSEDLADLQQEGEVQVVGRAAGGDAISLGAYIRSGSRAHILYLRFARIRGGARAGQVVRRRPRRHRPAGAGSSAGTAGESMP